MGRTSVDECIRRRSSVVLDTMVFDALMKQHLETADAYNKLKQAGCRIYVTSYTIRELPKGQPEEVQRSKRQEIAETRRRHNMWELHFKQNCLITLEKFYRSLPPARFDASLLFDTFIAIIAVSNRCVVATDNIQDFDFSGGPEILPIAVR